MSQPTQCHSSLTLQQWQKFLSHSPSHQFRWVPQLLPLHFRKYFFAARTEWGSLNESSTVKPMPLTVSHVYGKLIVHGSTFVALFFLQSSASGHCFLCVLEAVCGILPSPCSWNLKVPQCQIGQANFVSHWKLTAGSHNKTKGYLKLRKSDNTSSI